MIIQEYIGNIVESKFKNRNKFGCYFTQMRKRSQQIEEEIRATVKRSYDMCMSQIREQFIDGIKKYTQTVIDSSENCVALINVSECLKDFVS